MKNLSDAEKKLKEIKRLSRLARFTGVLAGLTGTALLILAVLGSASKGFTLVTFILAVIVGLIWHRSVKLVGIGLEMRSFPSFEEYLEHVKEQIRLEEEERRKDLDDF